MQKTYFINLDRDHIRLRRFTEQMDSLNITGERITAVDGLNLSDEEANAKISPQRFRKHCLRDPTKNEIACALSHLNCLQQMQIDQHDVALILEDDVQLSAEAVRNFPDIVKWISNQGTAPCIFLCSPVKYYHAKPSFTLDKINIHRIYGRAYFAHAYFINAAAARNITTYFAKHKLVSVIDDWQLWENLKLVKLYCTIPYLFNTNHEPSNLNTGRSRSKISGNKPMRTRISRSIDRIVLLALRAFMIVKRQNV